MMSNNNNLGATVTKLYALASALEGQGQYNVAKLVRAAADSALRKSAYRQKMPSKITDLAEEVTNVTERLSQIEMDQDLVAAIRRGGSAMAKRRLTMFDETPHPFVCRICGHVEMQFPTSDCPTCRASPRTFQRFLPVYWLEALDPFEALFWLRNTPNEVERLIGGLDERQLNHQVEAQEWSISNALSHLRDAQGVLDYRVNLLLEQDNPLIESQAVFEWATDEAERPPTATEIFETYQASRRKTLETLKGLPLLDWWREGQHEEFGVVSIKQQASYFATHELTHLPQIYNLKHHVFERI
ncbi:MAG: DinB family protein [Anaerolineales bacterium]|jgi:rubrerythrin